MHQLYELESPTKYLDRSPLSLVPDFYNRYPGEEVQIFAQVTYKKEFSGAILSIALPDGLELIEHSISDSENDNTFVRDLPSGQVIDWHLEKSYSPGQQLSMTIRTHVLNPGRLVYLVCVAEINDRKGEFVTSENVRVAIHPSGNYVRHLPEIYQEHDFLGRYLMLFESFWKPINQQINQIDLYFDPAFTPINFLPWLASWLGVTWDETLPENRKRKLLQGAVRMYQRRGTKSALEDYLRIYTDGNVGIIEHRSQNFMIGKETKLGAAVALGAQNMPHTFTVNVKIDEKELERMDARDRSRNESAYYQKLENIIEDRKPAHTGFHLNLEIENSINSEHMVGRDVQ